MRTSLLLLLAAVAFAGEPYRAGTRDAAAEVIGTLSDCHEAQALVIADGSGAMVRVTGIAGKIKIGYVLPPFSIYRPGSGWLSLEPLADAEKDAVIEAVWIATSDPVRFLSLKDGATVLGTLYHETGGVVLQVELVKGERTQNGHHDFATPGLAVRDYLNAVLAADARGVRKVLAGKAYDEFEKGMEASKTDDEGMAGLAKEMTERMPAVTDELRVHGQPSSCWVRLLQRDNKRVVYHLVLSDRGWLIDDLAAQDPRPEALPAAAQAPSPAAQEKPALTVTVSLPSESLQEGERAVASFVMRNQGTSPVILLSIEPDQALEMSGGELSKALQAGEIEVDPVGGTIETRTLPPQAAMMPSTFPNVRHPELLLQGSEEKLDVIFKAPAGHVYAIHWKVLYAMPSNALADGAVYEATGSVTGQAVKVTTYRRAVREDSVTVDDLIKVDGIANPGVAHVALAVEVKPREFSFADACKRTGVIPSASTWYEPAQVWALSLNGRTWIVDAGGHMSDFSSDYVPMLSVVHLSDQRAIRLTSPPGEKDVFAIHLETNASIIEQGKDGREIYSIEAKDLINWIATAESEGFVIAGGSWKKLK